ncbi:bifunctional copper resistance protein CopD/cytochrome c oxidase assembly protein [Amycolatopsis aidingensis]|uniref:bifunctional copper resistance protein CopD/cytochrome c oxidase assembly protein n=1 Tax=Amycolatopsis aidingensis TaxID=2842453 RepID=UPI001C0C3DBE|nr:bifunctional copper resistance protein CopD/cytochrome c oxidase assembly protein [Amycolatopsis aidingensis]
MGSNLRRPILALLAPAAVVVVVLTVLVGEAGYLPLGNGDPGRFTSLGTTLLRLVVDVTGALCVGSLAFAAFLTPAQRSGWLAADGYAALRTAGAAAIGWACAAAALVVFDAADSVGKPVSAVLSPAKLLGNVEAIEEPKAWLVSCVLVAVVAVAARFVLGWLSTVLLFAVAVFALLPPAVSGHTASGAWHDVATNSLLWHVVAAALWIGTLVALLAHLRRKGAYRELAVRRYRTLATICWVTLALSGIVNGLTAATPEGLTSTGYGLLTVAKAVLLCALGAVGLLARKRFAAHGGRLAIAELALLGLTIGASVGLAHIPPPALLNAAPSVLNTILGYELPLSPTAAILALDWRFDLVLGTVSVLAVACYLLGVRKLRGRGDRWPVGRTAAWLCGWAAVLVATSSGLGKYSPGSFSLHMIVHMTLNMLAPVLLALAGPITLAFRALPVAGRGNPAGLREWLVALIHSRVARMLTHPLVVSVLFVGSYYALYFSSLFGDAMLYHWGHQLMNVHFLVVGYLFYWLVIGIDPAPRSMPHLAKLGMLFAAMPFHAFFGVILMNKQTVIAETFYRYLSLPWMGDLLADQRLGGGIAWATGEIPLIIVVIALLAQWARHDEREAVRTDRTGDDDLAAYNAMLAKLAERERR